MSQFRQLAAIMFTDIVGYTTLMGNDEQKTFVLLNKNRQIQKPVIEAFNGKFIKELGDGILASFSSVSDAVNAAIKIQEACSLANDFQLRIGIHLGEVVFENEDIFGDGVNIASRIQALATPGGIYISESVYNNISNKQGIETRFVTQETLKNVREPVRIYEVLTSLATGHFIATIKEQAKKLPEKSIAVLPFVNMSNDPEQEYFSDGIAEEIINSLAHIKDLKIAGRTSSARFKGQNIDLRDVGKKLGVGTVLEGSIRKQANRIRITAQLINVEDGFHLWSEKYDRNMDDIFAIQDDIALAITEQLKITLLKNDREIITKSATQNTEAYELYLKGTFHVNRRGSSIITGLEYFRQAIVLDPYYALAYYGLSNANFLMAFYSFLPGKVAMKEVKQAIEKAIQLDNSIGEAYFSLACYYLFFEWNWVEAKKNYNKSIELNPKFAQAHSIYGMACLGWVYGNYEEGSKQCRIAVRLEPLGAIDHADLAWLLYSAGRFDEALTIAGMGIDLDSNSFLSQRVAGLCFIALKRYEEAIDIFTLLIKKSNRHQHAINSLIWAHCSNGNFEAPRELMTELEKRSATEYIGAAHFALSAAYLGDIDLSFNYFEKAYNDRDPILVTLKYLPYVPDVLRNHIRFKNLLERIGFP